MATDRLRAEQIFHDYQAHGRAHSFRQHPESLIFQDDAYLNHETWIRPAFDQLGDVRGRRVLDFGCGHGMAAIVLARRGAHVTAFDLSAGYLHEAATRAAANRVSVRWLQANGERLPFADRAFDRIWGNAVLHHLDVEVVGRDIRRVLAPGGVAVFCEPWGENRLLECARRYAPYPGKGRTAEETPLRRRHIEILRQVFPHIEMRGFQLLGMARRVLPRFRALAGLDWCDAMLLRRMPAFERWCRYVVIALRREAGWHVG